MTIDEARNYIAMVHWQFVRRMPQWPHEYTVREWRQDLEDDFLALVALIRERGVVKAWPADSPRPRYHHGYLEIDGWEYWSMGAPIEDVGRPKWEQVTRTCPESEPAAPGLLADTRPTPASGPGCQRAASSRGRQDLCALALVHEGDRSPSANVSGLHAQPRSGFLVDAEANGGT